MSLTSKSKMFTSIYIPHVFPNIDKKFISNFFEKYYGQVSHIDIVSRMNKKEECYNSVYVHFSSWYNNQSVKNFLNRIEENQSTKVVYQDPWFWLVMKNTGKKYKSFVPKMKINLDDIEETPNPPPPTPLKLVDPSVIYHLNDKDIEISPFSNVKVKRGDILERPKLIRSTNYISSPSSLESCEDNKKLNVREKELETEIQKLMLVINQQKLTIDDLYEKLETGTVESDNKMYCIN